VCPDIHQNKNQYNWEYAIEHVSIPASSGHRERFPCSEQDPPDYGETLMQGKQLQVSGSAV
jgi:hypothetical protein